MDTYQGNGYDPVTLHKYLYANANPVMYTDPTGNFSIGSTMSAMGSMMNLSLRAYNLYDNAMLFLDIARGDMTMLDIALTYLTARALPPRIRKCVGRNSFTGDTLVHTAHGLTPISEIKIGDLVWSHDENTGDKSLQEIVHLIQSEGTKDLLEVELESGTKITATQDHPFYQNSTKQWLDISEFEIGDSLYTLDNRELRIESSRAFQEFAPVFNLTVNNFHTTL